MLTPMASVTPRAAQLSRFLPLLLNSYTFPGPPQPPFGQEPYAVIGDPRAPVVIVQFADFQCPFCQRHHAQTEPQIYDQYIRTGLVRYVVKDFPLSSIHPQAQKASEAAECAGQQDGYWTMHDKLYDEQGEWSGNSGAVALFEQYARNQGLDGDAFDTCLEMGAFYGEVRGDFQEGITAGINGVPWFFLYGPTFNTQIIGAQPFSVFQTVIDNLLNGTAPTPTPTPSPIPTSTPLPPTNFFEDESYAVQGSAEAPVIVVEFADYQCPFCQRHYQQTLPQIQADYVAQGVVRYMVKDFPLSTIHPQAQKASEAVECAGAQGAYWQMHDRLYDEQQQWSSNPSAVELFEQYARNLGLDGPAFDTCLEDGTFAAEVSADQAEGVSAGVRGTPAFFFFGPHGSAYLPGAYPYSAFQQIINSLLDGEMAIATTPPQQERGLCLNLP